MKIRRSLFVILAFSSSLRAEIVADTPHVTAQAAQAYRASHEKAWAEKIGSSESRLFYLGGEWPAVITRLNGLEGRGAEWRAEFFQAADRIVEAPILSYEKEVKPGDIGEEWQRPVGNDMFMLALAAKLSPDPKYARKLHELVLAACAYPSWGKENNDLATGHVASGIAIAYDWHKDLFSDDERALIRKTIAERVSKLFDGLTGRMYWANNYHWNHNQISVAGLGLAGLAFLGEIPAAGDWLAAALLDYQNVGRYSSPDGSSCEGMGYWTYGRSFILKFIEGTKEVTDSGDLYHQPFLQNAISLRLGASTPGFQAVLRWADGQGYDFSGAQQILYRLAAQYHDGKGQYLADHLPYAPHHGPKSEAFGWTLLWYDPSVKEEPPGFLDYHAPAWDVITSRSGWGDGDYMLSMKSGPTNDAHTHLDAGALSFIMGKKWFLTTSGYGDGREQPGFWDREAKRWTFFSNATESHSTLLINGKNQLFPVGSGCAISPLASGLRTLWAEVDLSKAYGDVTRVSRAVFHHRGQYALVLDDIEAEKPVRAEWLAQVDPSAEITEGVITETDHVGSMILRMLDSGPAFALRAPTSPIVDVKPTLLKTCSAATEGSSIQLAALLQFTFAGEKPAVIKEQHRRKEGIETWTLQGDAWSDSIQRRAGSGPLGDGAVSANASALIVSRQGDQIQTVSVIGASEISHPAFAFRAEAPLSMTADSAPDGAYILRFDSDWAGAIEGRQGLRLLDLNGREVTGDHHSAGWSALVSDAAQLPRLREWLQAALNASRP